MGRSWEETEDEMLEDRDRWRCLVSDNTLKVETFRKKKKKKQKKSTW
jgi:hypothetical protein